MTNEKLGRFKMFNYLHYLNLCCLRWPMIHRFHIFLVSSFHRTIIILSGPCDTKALRLFWLENYPAQHPAENNSIMTSIIIYWEWIDAMDLLDPIKP